MGFHVKHRKAHREIGCIGFIVLVVMMSGLWGAVDMFALGAPGIGLATIIVTAILFIAWMWRYQR